MRTTALLFLLAVSCADERAGAGPGERPQAPPTEPDVVTVDHILIGVKGRLPVQRSESEARRLAQDLIDQLEAGADWSTLKNEYSEDPPTPGRPKGGPYTMDRHQPRGDRVNIQRGVFAKADMAPSFGDVSFALEVGEIGLAEYDANDSPFGYHIIKRIK